MPDILYHFTCSDHGMPGIERDGYLRPNPHPLLPELGPLVWLTDLSGFDDPVVTGLTSGTFVTCDRTEIRYPVFKAEIDDLHWWPFIRSRCRDRVVLADLERYGWPTYWWVARCRVPVRAPA